MMWLSLVGLIGDVADLGGVLWAWCMCRIDVRLGKEIGVKE
jgi:hypothetical protein